MLTLSFFAAPLALGLSPNCTCSQFCAKTCAASTGTTVATETVYRLTPNNVTGIADKDSGTAAGDLGFYLHRYSAIAKCKPPMDANTNECFLAYEPVIRRFEIEWDQAWGPYFRCNPMPFPTNDALVDTLHWGCYPWHGRGPTPWVPPTHGSGSSTSCPTGTYCPALMNTSVGRDPAQHGAYDKKHPNLARYFGGHWFSTPAQAECTGDDDRKPGDGKSPHCSWRLSPTAKPLKAVNATCMDARLFPVIQNNGQKCFATLPHPLNSTSDGYVKCIDSAVMGCGGDLPTTCAFDVAATIKPIAVASIVGIWETAFTSDDVTKGGCPAV